MRPIDADALITDIKECIEVKDAYCEWEQIEGLEVALSCIDETPTVQPEPKWIPCSERLPEKDGKYLVFHYYARSPHELYAYDVMSFANDLYKIDEYDFCDKKGKKGWFYCSEEYGCREDFSVTAWMPLPKPYRGEQE